MAKRKDPESWADKIGPDAVAPEAPHEDPLVQKVAAAAEMRQIFIQMKVIQRELYLAKARILELELLNLGVGPGQAQD